MDIERLHPIAQALKDAWRLQRAAEDAVEEAQQALKQASQRTWDAECALGDAVGLPLSTGVADLIVQLLAMTEKEETHEHP